MTRVVHQNFRVGVAHSLRTQLFVGTVVLLTATIAAVGFSLIVHQKRTLTSEMEKTVILQGRNIALSSGKPLLRSDPEFELYPLVHRILREVDQILSVAVVDADGIVQGHEDLSKISEPLAVDTAGRSAVVSPIMRAGERLYQDDDTYLFVTPVLADRPIGSVHLEYSKGALVAGLRYAVRLAVVVSIGALVVGLGLALIFFERISRPLIVMVKAAERLGKGDLKTTIAMPTKNEFRVLAQSFNEMAEHIARAQNELVAKERIDRELEIAREIQRSLIPAALTPPAGYEIGHYYQAAAAVGGDYVDVVPVSPSKIGLVMADVSGKGVPGLVVMVMVKILAHELVGAGGSPAEALRKLNSAISKNIGKNMFVTLWVAILDTETGSLTCANAGHNPMLIYDHGADSVRYFKMDGMPLGVFEGDVFDSRVRDYRLNLRPGDVVLQYTDGLNESQDKNGQRLTMAGIDTVARRCARRGANVLVRELVKAESRFRGSASQYDDITLLALGPVGPQSSPARGASLEKATIA